MKTKLLLPLASLLLLTACPKINPQDSSLQLKVICPTGAPSIAFYNHVGEANFETNKNPTNIAAYLNGASDYDVVVIDTTTGVQAIQGGSDFKIAATITLGNFYLASTSEENTTLDENDVIVLFGNQNALPYKIFTYLYGTTYKTEFASGGVDKAASVLQTGKNLATGHKADWVFIAEPYLYQSQSMQSSIIYNKNYTVIDIQNEYKNKTTDLPLMQASVFINKSVEKEAGDKFLENLKNDIEKCIATPFVIKDALNEIEDPMTVNTKLGISVDVISQTMKTNRLGLGFKSAIENKTAIDMYLKALGMNETQERIYW